MRPRGHDPVLFVGFVSGSSATVCSAASIWSCTRTCWYRSSVIRVVEWPSCSETILVTTFASSARVAAVCRVPWNLITGGRQWRQRSGPLTQALPRRGERPVRVPRLGARPALCHPGPDLRARARPGDWPRGVVRRDQVPQFPGAVGYQRDLAVAALRAPDAEVLGDLVGAAPMPPEVFEVTGRVPAEVFEGLS